jgi:hypothetical protein
MATKQTYDWAQAIFALATTNTSDLRELASAAGLNPEAGDLADVDLSEMDLRDQNLSGWDLSMANFRDAKLAGAQLQNAIVDPLKLVQASDWEEANLDPELRARAIKLSLLTKPIGELRLQTRTLNALDAVGIKLIGDLAYISEAEALRIPDFGRRSFVAAKRSLEKLDLHFGMDLPDWRFSGSNNYFWRSLYAGPYIR